MIEAHRAFRPARFLEAGQPRGEAEFGGVLIHGRDRTPAEMIDLSSRLHLSNFHWIAPFAGNDGSWYPGTFMDPVASNEPALTEAIQQIDHALGRASENGRLPADRLVLMGFSQGACLAVEYALRNPGRCRNLVVLTGGLFGPPGTRWKGSPTMLTGTRVLLTGSDADDWIPEARVHETARVLAGFGAAVNLQIYPGRPHEVSNAELAETGAFIRNSPC